MSDLEARIQALESNLLAAEEQIEGLVFMVMLIAAGRADEIEVEHVVVPDDVAKGTLN